MFHQNQNNFLDTKKREFFNKFKNSTAQNDNLDLDRSPKLQKTDFNTFKNVDYKTTQADTAEENWDDEIACASTAYVPPSSNLSNSQFQQKSTWSSNQRDNDYSTNKSNNTTRWSNRADSTSSSTHWSNDNDNKRTFSRQSFRNNSPSSSFGRKDDNNDQSGKNRYQNDRFDSGSSSFRQNDYQRNSNNSGSSFGRSSGGYGGFGSSDRGGFGYNRNQTTTTTPLPSSSSNDNDQSTPKTPKGFTIDWNLVRSQPEQNMAKFENEPPIIKNFYIESPEVAAMTYEEACTYRKANFNITVELFKKEDYTKKLENKTPEEAEIFLRQTVPNPVKTFEQAFSHYPEILEQCRLQKFNNPTPIQSQMWPILMKGLDCVGIAQTGTGKTLAFLLPALIHIDGQTTPRSKRSGPNVLVLSPTRELALQIEQEVKKINYKGIKSVCVYGGGNRKEQINICTKGVEIIIGTPGRLYDLIQADVIKVTSVTYLVLDEADRMLDLGFEPQILKILLNIRPDRQTVMTSATWPFDVRRLATKYLKEPLQLYVGTLDLRAAKSVDQHIVMLESEDERKSYFMNYIENVIDKEDKIIVFVGRKATVDALSCDLILKDVSCQSIHGDRDQSDREQALEDFKSGYAKILIATDVASRGLDIKDISCVFNYDFPHNMEEYVHRVGRTGRAGRTGMSITLMTRNDWKHAKELIEILRQGDQEVPKSLVDMADRFEAAKLRRMEENGGDFPRRGRGSFRGRGRSHGGW